MQVQQVIHSLGLVVVHLPVEVSIAVSVGEDLVVELLDMSHAFLVVFDRNVNSRNESVEVLLVLGGNQRISIVLLPEPGHDLILVIVECESRLIKSTAILQSEGLESKHVNDVCLSGVEFVSHECFNLWYNVSDVSTMEVGVVHHIGDNFVVSSLANCLSRLDEGTEPGPVVFVEDSDFKGEVLKRSLPIAQE